MARNDNHLSTQLDRDLAALRLLEIATHYREVLDEAARKGSSMLEVLATLIGMEQTVRQQRALERRLRQARLPKPKTLTDYDFNFPKRIPKAAIVRLFDCDFIPPARLRRPHRPDRDRENAPLECLGLHRL
jgi:DNA replication protein